MSLTNTELENELSRLAGVDAVDSVVIQTPIVLLATGEVLQNWGLPQVYFIADRAYEITSIREAHDTLQTSADGCSLMISKVTGTTAPDAATLHLITDTAFSGEDNVYKGFNLKGIAINTVTSGTMTNQVSSLTLVAGDRLVWGINGTILSTFVQLTTVLKKV
jgi:hypothetical protein